MRGKSNIVFVMEGVGGYRITIDPLCFSRIDKQTCQSSTFNISVIHKGGAVSADKDANVRKVGGELLDRIEKTWNRLKIVRSAGRRDFQTYEFVLYESLSALRALVMDHERRLSAIEQELQKGK